MKETIFDKLSKFLEQGGGATGKPPSASDLESLVPLIEKFEKTSARSGLMATLVNEINVPLDRRAFEEGEKFTKELLSDMRFYQQTLKPYISPTGQVDDPKHDGGMALGMALAKAVAENKVTGEDALTALFMTVPDRWLPLREGVQLERQFARVTADEEALVERLRERLSRS